MVETPTQRGRPTGALLARKTRDAQPITRQSDCASGIGVGGRATAAAAKAGRRAVELDPSNADAHSALAFAEFYGLRRLEDGIAHFERARDIDAGSAKIRHWLANALLHLGRFDDALAEISEAQRLDPASPSILASKGLALFCAGRTEEAVALLTGLARSERDLSSPHAYLAFVYLAQGDYSAYFGELRTVGRMRGDLSRVAVADVTRGEEAGCRWRPACYAATACRGTSPITWRRAGVWRWVSRKAGST